jgi:hypothetical protein
MQRRSPIRSSGRRAVPVTAQQRLEDLRRRVAARRRAAELPPLVEDEDIEYVDEEAPMDMGDAGDEGMGDLGGLDLGDLSLEDIPAEEEGESCPEGEHQECSCVADEEAVEKDEEDETEEKEDKDEDKEEKKDDEKEDKDEDKEEKEDKKDDKKKEAAVGTFDKFRQLRDAKRKAAETKVVPKTKKVAEPTVVPVTDVAPPAAAPEAKPVEAAAETKWAPLITEESLAAEKNPVVEMQLRGANTDDPYYILWINDKPVGEVHEADVVQDDEDMREVFRSSSYVKGVQEVVSQTGAAETLKTLGLRYYAANTQETDAIKRAKAEIVANADLAFRSRVAAAKNDLFNAAQLAMTASVKNFILENALKDALVENFRSAGTSEGVAIDLIEDAFQRGGPQYLKAMLDKADEWMGSTPETLKQLETEITRMAYSHPRTRFSSQFIDDEIPQPTVRVPVAPQMAPRAAQVAQVVHEAALDDLDAMAEAAKRAMRRR